MSWTKFYDFNEVLEIKHFADKKGLARDWKCKFDGEILKFLAVSSKPISFIFLFNALTIG